MPAGRPTKMTAGLVEKLEYAFSIGCTDEEACFYADINKATLYNYQDKHPEFIDRKNALKTRPVFLARESVIKGFRGDPSHALRFLERKVKGEFSLRTEMTGKDGADLPAPILGGAAVQKDGDET